VLNRYSGAKQVFTEGIAVDKDAAAIDDAFLKPLSNGEYAVGMRPAVDGGAPIDNGEASWRWERRDSAYAAVGASLLHCWCRLSSKSSGLLSFRWLTAQKLV
jgi:hypothetical protein